MEIICPTCQQKLQIADTYAGQMVKCPSCAATFQAPSLPTLSPMPLEPMVPGPGPSPARDTFALAPDALPPTPAALPPLPPQSETIAEPAPKGEYTRSFTIHLRQEAVAQIAPIGMIILFFLSFFSWHFGTLNLWQLAFPQGFVMLLIYVLLFILAAPIVLLTPLIEKNLLPTPAPLRPYVPWSPLVSANLILAAWVFFLIHYVQCIFIEPFDPATLWMKLAFRLHTLIAAAALMDLWLRRRRRRGLPEPTIQVRW